MNLEKKKDIVLNIENIKVRTAKKILFQNLSLKVKEGEHWMLIGASGSGKTGLLKLIEGHFNILEGKITRHFYHDYLIENSVSDPLFSYTNLIASVPEKHHFKNNSNTSTFYYQQRYNSFDSEDSASVAAYLEDIYASSLLQNKAWTVSKVLNLLMLDNLAEKQLIKLSNGETKRLLIAAALVKNPILLLLDNPLVGLDVPTRAQFDSILKAIVESGINIIMTGTSTEIPDFISHVGFIKDGRICRSWKKSEYSPEFAAPLLQDNPKEKFDVALFKELHGENLHPRYDHVVKLKEVNVKYGEKTILKNLSWTIKQGEHWVLSGPNGSGKSTLLSLINGDNPQVYANDVVLFDRKRGSGESIWDIKSNIGFVSPELHQYFPMESTCIQVIESGFYDTQGLYRKSNPEKKEIALKWMNAFNLLEFSSSFFKDISSGNQRLCLLARALIKNPPLLILDEPCQGLDVAQQKYFRQIVEELCKNSNTTIIYVTHYKEEIPEGFGRELKLG